MEARVGTMEQPGRGVLGRREVLASGARIVCHQQGKPSRVLTYHTISSWNPCDEDASVLA
jgi:hypothetical protein